MRVIADLTEQEFHQLQELALIERRPLRDQAAFLLAKALAETEKTVVKESDNVSGTATQ